MERTQIVYNEPWPCSDDGHDYVDMELAVSREGAIKLQKWSATKHGHTYATDQDALDDFMAVNWATQMKAREWHKETYSTSTSLMSKTLNHLLYSIGGVSLLLLALTLAGTLGYRSAALGFFLINMLCLLVIRGVGKVLQLKV